MSMPPRPASPRSVPTESKRKIRERAGKVWDLLAAAYPDAHCELDYKRPLELLVATILSAQCTDRRVNLVTPALFARCPTAADYASAPPDELERLIHSTGFFRNKAKNIRAACAVIATDHGGKVPADLDALTALPGVGRKTANVVLGNAFGIHAGIVVDTHVGRLARRLAFTRHTDPVKIETDLTVLVPVECWTLVSHWLIWHGRRRCPARKPDCPACELRALCPSATP